MKNVFWGYDPREVNETVEFLESQNESLNAKIANLNLELLAKTEQLEAKEVGASALSNEEKNELTALRSRVESLTNENTRIKNDNNVLVEKTARLERVAAERPVQVASEPTAVSGVTSVPVIAPGEGAEQVGEMFQMAISEIASIKCETTETMRKYVVDYITRLENANRRMREILSGINAAKTDAKNTFIGNVEAILEDFEELTNESYDLENEFDSLDHLKAELDAKVESLLSNIDRTALNRQQDAEPEAEEYVSAFPPHLTKALTEKKGRTENKKAFDEGKSIIKFVSNKEPDDIKSVNM